jgi:hypothetical protein
MPHYQPKDEENMKFLHNWILFNHKKNEILSFASKWLELENIILNKFSQAQKAKNLCSSSYVDYRHETNA